jgi:hypothetical protein
MARTKGNSKNYKKATQSRIPSPSRSPSLASYHTTPLHSPQRSPTPENRIPSPAPIANLPTVSNLEATDTITILAHVFTEQQLQQFADQNRRIHIDVIGDDGICTRIPPTPLSSTTTPLSNELSMEQRSGLPVLRPSESNLENACPNPGLHSSPDSHPRDPPKTFAEVISGTTPHTRTYDALTWKPLPKVDMVPIPQPVATPSYPSERAGVPRDIQQRNLECNQPAPDLIAIPDSGHQAIELWNGLSASTTGPLYAVGSEPTRADRLGSEYLHNTTSRNYWRAIVYAIRQREHLRRDYDEAADRTALLINLARSTELPQAFARYVRENPIDTLSHTTGTRTTPHRTYERTNPSSIPTSHSNELPSSTLPTNNRGTSSGKPTGRQGNGTTTSRIHKDTNGDRKIPTQPRAMNEFIPEAFCKKCERLHLPAQGHWASHCIHTVCPTCQKSKPAHYKWNCPRYVCTICKLANPQHKPKDCPQLSEHIAKTEALRKRGQEMHNARAELESYDFDDGVSMDYSTISRG